MNSYNENLRASTIKTLDTLEQQVCDQGEDFFKAREDLFEKCGVNLLNNDKLNYGNDYLDRIERLDSNVQHIKNSTTDLFHSVKESIAGIDALISNSATSAANIDISTNAITKLAADVSNVYSIITAENSDSGIYQLAGQVNDLMQETAHKAEENSHQAMEMSQYTAEISIKSVGSFAEKTIGSIDTLKTATESYRQKIGSKTTDFSTSRVKFESDVSKSESEFINSEDGFQSANAALDTTNDLINQSLTVRLDQKNPPQSIAVEFNSITSAFDDNSSHSNYPVKQYYLLITKASKKDMFTMGKAATIVSNHESSYVAVTMPEKTLKHFEITIDFNSILDTDGERITNGESYVIFLLAEFDLVYKKTLEDYDDYLSAPTSEFMPKLTLTAPKADDLLVDSNRFSFEADSDVNQSIEVEYRCMMLPATSRAEARHMGFNLEIAKQIPYDHYLVARKSDESKEKKLIYEAEIKSVTTDCFGNTLVDGNKYVPVVLAHSLALKTPLDRYNDSLSDFKQTGEIIFKDHTNRQTFVHDYLSLSEDDINEVNDQLIDVQQNTENIESLIKTANKQIKLAVDQTQKVNETTKEVSDKLIYSAKVLNRLSVMVNKKKASNPLISDELISKLLQSTTDANNAIVLELSTQESINSTNAMATESEVFGQRIQNQARDLINEAKNVEPIHL